MRSNRALVVVAIALCSLVAGGAGTPRAFAAPQHHEKKHDVKKQVEILEEKWRTVLLTGDYAAMDKMLADDFIGISMSGQLNTKAQQLERVRTRKFVISRLELSDMKVKLVDSVAIVTSVADLEGTNEGVSVKGQYRYTRIYRRVPSDGWKVTSFEATRIAPHRNRTNQSSGIAMPPAGAEPLGPGSN
ncbi:nuclear transport factor 2 family protein [Edaphobacter bradus]|uniref:nuclear transport factor 2 family protein n=1 Tax=Edaphobacter bradus TaxID=2259016 RepID=UPI0021E0B521|nr:nuclear transport factor 2 family protein [Edaphobacter bradus]